MDLRKYVGHKTLLMPCSSVILLNEKNQILLQKRKDNSKWGLHGGSIEIDEDCKSCAERELKEETNLVADELEFFKVYSGKKFHFKYPNGDEVNTIEIVYICKKFHGEMKKQDEEVLELKFFDFNNLPSQMMNNSDEIIKEYYLTYLVK